MKTLLLAFALACGAATPSPVAHRLGAVEQFANNAASPLASGISSVATTLSVASAAKFPAVPQFRIIVDGELMLVTGVSGNTFTVNRGIEGTTPVAHAAGATITQIITAGGLLAAITQGGQIVTAPTWVYVDGTNGNDSNACVCASTACSTTPCQTYAEVQRRLGRRPYFNAQVDVYITNDLVSTDSLLLSGVAGPSGYWNVHGVPSVQYSGTLSGATAYNQSTNQWQEIQDGTLDFTPYVGSLAEITRVAESSTPTCSRQSPPGTRASVGRI